MAGLHYAPDFQLGINGQPVPAALRASVASVQYQTGLEGADRVELSVVNENLRWLDHELLALDNVLSLDLGYAPDPLKKIFIGEIVSQSPTFPGSGLPMLTLAAQDRRQHLQEGSQVRWFAIPVPKYGNMPMPDTVVASMVAMSNRLMPLFDPISAALSVLMGGIEVAVAMDRNDPKMMQALIRKQVGESNLEFLKRISHENGWEMLMDYDGPLGGYQLRFMSLAEKLSPDVTLKYGQSLIDFTPRITKVGAIASVSVKMWISSIKQEFTVKASFDWDRKSLDLSISAGFGLPGNLSATPESLAGDAKSAKTAQDKKSTQAAQSQGQEAVGSDSVDKPDIMLADQPVSPKSAPRFLLSKLLAQLNRRLTGSGSTIGDPRIQAGTVLRLEGLGQRFGGLYRVTSATHTLDGSGYRTSFEVRKEIWFESIPLSDQGAVKILIPQHQFS